MPPASMAKMMTTEVAFELIDKGELPLNKMCTVRPETWQKWHGPQAGSTMFLSPGNEQVSVENLLHGIVTLSGNDASVVLAECIAGTEQAFAGQMNALAKQLGLTNSHFGNSQRLARRGRDLCHRARPRDAGPGEIERHPKLYKQFYASRASPGARRWARAPTSPRQPQPDPRQDARRRRLKTGHTDEAGYGFTGSAEQNGRRLVMVVAGLTASTSGSRNRPG
jgi:D-alanyl-D-alanine carboxypeptidase (penicillin-binding protein 5/6)